MKKVLAICLIMAMVISMSVTAFAAPGGFVSSPSGNPAPELVSFDPHDDDCTGSLIITPYSGRDTLPEELEELLKKAYDEVAASDDLTKLNDDLAKLAADKKIKGTNLAVSDLFDAHVVGCDIHEGHFDFDVVLKADTLKHFVGLMYMDENGEWNLVSNAEVVDGNYLKFTADKLCPFAIIVDTGVEEPDAPKTGDDSLIPVYAIIMAVAALAIIVIAVKSKKQKA